MNRFLISFQLLIVFNVVALARQDSLDEDIRREASHEQRQVLMSCLRLWLLGESSRTDPSFQQCHDKFNSFYQELLARN